MNSVEKHNSDFIIEEHFTLKNILEKIDNMLFFNIQTIYGTVKYRYDYDIRLISVFLNDELLIKSDFSKMYFSDNFKDIEFLIAILEATDFIYRHINYINAPDDD